jgi:PAS domain S-box-containing protein
MIENIGTQKSQDIEYITLNEGDSSYHFLFDENPSLSFIINYERRIQDVNKKCCEILGLRKIDLIGKDPLDIIPPHNRYILSNVIDQLFNKEIVTAIETDIITKNGEIKRLLFSPGRLIGYNNSFAVLLSGVDITETKKILQEFESGNQLFSRFMNLLTAGIYIKDEFNACIFRNKFISDNFNPEVINDILSEDEESRLSLTRFVTLKDKNNTDRFCEITSFKIYNDSGKYTGGIVFDLTEKIESEKSRKEHETIFKTVFENSTIGILLADLEGNILEVNPSFIQMTGYQSEELKKLSLRDITNTEDYLAEEGIIQRALQTESRETLQLQKRYISKDKEAVWAALIIKIIRNESGLPIYTMHITENITEKKAIKEALDKFEYRNKAIVSALPDLIFIIDKDGYYLDYCSGPNRDLAIEEAKLIGSNITVLFPPESAELVIDKIRNCIMSGIQDHIEYELTIAGAKKYYKAGIVKYDDQSILGVVRNITEEKSREKQMKDYEHQLAELNASRNRLFSIIAHELRSPFHALIGLSEIIASDVDSLTKEEIKKIGNMLNTTFRNEYQLLENLLSWSGIQQDRININPVELNLSELVDKVFYILSWLAKNKNIQMFNNVNKDLIIKYDENLMYSILQNLLTNALKFSMEGGSISIDYFKSHNINNIEIKDEGVGLSSEEIEKIFNEDVVYSSTGTAQERGSGLGLNICREFVEKHGGKLYIKSSKGSGTTVGFTFP